MPPNIFKSAFPFPWPELHLPLKYVMAQISQYLPSQSPSFWLIRGLLLSILKLKKLSITFQCPWDKAQIPLLMFWTCHKSISSCSSKCSTHLRRNTLLHQADVLTGLCSNLSMSTNVNLLCAIHPLGPTWHGLHSPPCLSFYPPWLWHHIPPFPLNLTSSLPLEVDSQKTSRSLLPVS